MKYLFQDQRLDDMGRYNSSPSGFRVFQLSSGANITLNDVTIKGGAVSFGGAINAANGTTLRVNNSIISNSLSSGFYRWWWTCNLWNRLF